MVPRYSISVSRHALQAMEDPKGRQGGPGAQYPPPGYQAGYPAGAPPPAPYGGYPAGPGAAPYYAPGVLPAPPALALTAGYGVGWTCLKAHRYALFASRRCVMAYDSGGADADMASYNTACAPALSAGTFGKDLSLT